MRTYRAVIGDGSVVSTTSHPDSEPEKHALFAPFDHPPGLLTGTLMFLADLVRKIDLPMRLDFIGVSSYRDGTESTELVFTKELRLDVRDRDVLLVDDILDTGKTLRAVISKLESMQPRKINTCVLLSKKARREYDIPADYVGFEIPNEFVIGYGLDHAEQHRNLPFIGVLNVSSER